MNKNKQNTGIILFFIIVLLLGSAYIIAQTSEAQKKIDEQIANSDTPIGEKLGLGKDRNSDIIGNNVKLTREANSENTKIDVIAGGSVKIKYKDGQTREYSSLEALKTSKGDITPVIYVDKDGFITEAYFTVGKQGKYVFGNEEVNLPKGAGVIFKDGIIDIKLPAGTKIESPQVVDSSNNKRLSFSFLTNTGENLVLPNDEKYFGQLKYNNGNFYFDSKEVTIGSLLVKNPNSVLTYLDFKGEQSNVPGAYISMNPAEKKIFIGTNTKDDSPSVLFLKGNPYGLNIEDTDLFAAKAIGDPTVKSYVMITDKDRSSKDLVPIVEIMGYGAVDEDNGAVGTYIKDGKIYKRAVGRFSNDFSNVAGTTTVPAEVHFYKLNEKSEKVAVSLKKGILNGKVIDVDEKIVVSNRNEWGIGIDPAWIKGEAYNSKYPQLTKGISNRISYNYVQFTAQGFQKYTGIPISLDSYAKGKMTQEQYKMLIDMVNGLTPESRKYLKKVIVDRVATMGGYSADAWGSTDGVIEISYYALKPGTIRHEITHTGTLPLSQKFWNEWISVGGGSRAFPSNYARTNRKNSQYGCEDAAEYGGEFAYRNLKETKGFLTGSEAKYFRAKMAVLLKYKVVDRATFDMHFANAGLACDDASIQKYIDDAKRR